MSQQSFNNIFHGDASNIQIQQDVSHSNQTLINSQSENYDKILQGVQQLQSEMQSFGLTSDQQVEFQKLLNSVKSSSEQQADKSIVQQGLNALKEFLMRTTTTLAATGAVTVINSFINSIT